MGKPKAWIGVDPGASGAFALLSFAGVVFARLDGTEHDVADEVRAWAAEWDCRAMLEQVSAMPAQGVSSTFQFGTSYGFCRGLLVALRIPFTTVTPAKWQSAMSCRTGGDKNVSKAAAQRMHPEVKVIHNTADALLLAEYARRTES